MITYGIHTRLKYLIKGIGGIDWNRRIEYIQSRYNISTSEAKLISKYNVESYLESMSINELIEYAKKKNERNKIKNSIMFNSLISMF